jgi:acetylornithine deacetylase
MTIDPFGARIENGRLYGRGACDVKGGMAAMLATFARLVREKPAGAANVTLACTVDEEHTFLGVQALASAGVRADMAVVAEPTQLQIINAHKGVVRWHVETHGRSCHSSAPERGVNAIYHMAQVVCATAAFADTLRGSRAHPRLGPATLSVGRIEGGTSANTVPDRCRIEIDRRVLPSEDPLTAPAELTDWLRQRLPSDVAFTCSEPWLCAPALGSEDSEQLVQLLGRAIDAVRGSHQVSAVAYGTDASTLAEAGIPAVVFGPGDIAKAHTCDEWVPLEEVEQASEILYRLACSS